MEMFTATEDWLNARLDVAYRVGQRSLARNMAEDARTRSGVLFGRGRDAEAELLRGIARDYDALADRCDGDVKAAEANLAKLPSPARLEPAG